jgi:hypothetical protein
MGSYVDKVIPAVTVPVGERGDFVIKKIVVDSEGKDRWQYIKSMIGHGRGVPSGEYTALYRKGKIVMSDTPDEKRDHLRFVQISHGHVLIAGLGIGMVLQAVLLREEVDFVTVVELEADVIEMVQPHYEKMFPGKFEVIHQSIFDFSPPKGIRYGAAWYDIWDEMSTDNRPEMIALSRKFGRRTEWQGSWGRDLVDLRWKEEKKQQEFYSFIRMRRQQTEDLQKKVEVIL